MKLIKNDQNNNIDNLYIFLFRMIIELNIYIFIL